MNSYNDECVDYNNSAVDMFNSMCADVSTVCVTDGLLVCVCCCRCSMYSWFSRIRLFVSFSYFAVVFVFDVSVCFDTFAFIRDIIHAMHRIRMDKMTTKKSHSERVSVFLYLLGVPITRRCYYYYEIKRIYIIVR